MKKRKFNAEFKTKVVLESLQESQTTASLAQKYKLHPQQITNWKKSFLANASTLFEKGKGASSKSEAELERQRFLQTIGELKVENDFLKKRL